MQSNLGQLKRKYKNRRALNNSETLDRDITEDLYYTGKKQTTTTEGKERKQRKIVGHLYMFFFLCSCFLFALYIA